MEQQNVKSEIELLNEMIATRDELIAAQKEYIATQNEMISNLETSEKILREALEEALAILEKPHRRIKKWQRFKNKNVG